MAPKQASNVLSKVSYTSYLLLDKEKSRKKNSPSQQQQQVSCSCKLAAKKLLLEGSRENSSRKASSSNRV
jgi:hypothetical protein